MTNTPTSDTPSGDGWIPEGWHSEPARPSRQDRFWDLLEQAAAASRQAYIAAVAWLRPRIAQIQKQAMFRVDVSARCGRHPDDIAAEQGVTPLYRGAKATWSTARWSTALLVVIGALAALVMVPTVMIWRPYTALQRHLGHHLDAGKVGTPGYRAVHFLQTSPALALVAYLLAGGITAWIVRLIGDEARHGHRAPVSRLLLFAAAIAAAAGVWRPIQHATAGIAGAGAGGPTAFAAAAVILGSWWTFASATARQAAAVNLLNRYTAIAAVAAESSGPNRWVDDTASATRTRLQFEEHLSSPGGVIPGARLDLYPTAPAEQARGVLHGVIHLVPGKQSLDTIRNARARFATGLGYYPDEFVITEDRALPPSKLRIRITPRRTEAQA